MLRLVTLTDRVLSEEGGSPFMRAISEVSMPPNLERYL